MTKMQRHKLCQWIKRSAVMAALLLFGACARQMPPPGGPGDVIPPHVVRTVPVRDSVGVALATNLEIHFSESMDHRSVEEAIFISPQSAQEPKFDWHGDVLELKFVEGLRADRTYVVAVGQASADEWGNRMVASYTFRFATGDAVNQGELHGRLVRSKEQMGQAYAWLYDLTVVSAPNVGRDRAHYVTQPDEQGYFQFSGLGPGVYRVFIFLDANQDREYTPGKDALGVAPQDVEIKKKDLLFHLGDIKSVVRDTASPVLSAVRTSDQHHVLMRFDEPVRLVSQPVIHGLDIRAVYQDVDSSRVGLFTSAQKRGQTYDVALSVSDRFDNRAHIQTSVKGDGSPDRRAPEILAVSPALSAQTALSKTPIEMIFSDAMHEVISKPFWVASDSTMTPDGQFVWGAANRLQFVPQDPWPVGRVVLKSQINLVKDLADNIMAEPVVIDFEIVDDTESGVIAGTLQPKDQDVIIEAVLVDNGQRIYQMQVAPGDSTFEIQGVLPGFYRISGFVDANGDGRWSAGQSVPFTPAEVLFHQADTVDVRARWRVETRQLDAQSGWFLLPETKDGL